MSCDPPPIASALPLGFGHGEQACFLADFDLAGRGFVQIPDLGTSRGLTLQRSRAEVGLRTADVGGRVALLFARSGGDTGYVGIAGESIVPVLEIAEGRWDWRETGLAVAAGLVDDVWVGFLEEAWHHSETLVVLEVDQDLVPRADVGGWVGWSSPGSKLSATVSLTTGEGFQRRERNSGTDLTGVVHLRPLPADGPALNLAVLGREGSRGLGQAPDHRTGAAAILSHRWVEAGVDGILGWGLRGDGALALSAGGSLWVAASDEAPFVALGRADASTDDRSTPQTAETTVILAGGPRFPFHAGARPAALTVGWEGRRWGVAAAPIAGAELLRGADLLFVQLSVRVRGSVPLEVP